MLGFGRHIYAILFSALMHEDKIHQEHHHIGIVFVFWILSSNPIHQPQVLIASTDDHISESY